jgi:hypothetical protein
MSQTSGISPGSGGGGSSARSSGPAVRKINKIAETEQIPQKEYDLLILFLLSNAKQ